MKSPQFRYWLMALVLACWSDLGTTNTGQPDERILWQLLQNGKFRLLKQAIHEYREQYPGWAPPRELVRAMKVSQHHPKPAIGLTGAVFRQIREAARERKWEVLIRLAGRHPRFFGCAHAGHMRLLALAFVRTGQPEQAAAHYRRVLRCRGVPAREILEQALWHLPLSVFQKVLGDATGLISSQSYAELDYLGRRRALVEAQQRQQWRRFEKLSDELSGLVMERRDLELVSMIAWAWYDRGNWQEAEKWFRRGLTLDPDNENLANGLLMTAIRLERDADVIAAARQYGKRYPSLSKKAASYLLARGWALYHQKAYEQSRRYAELSLSWASEKEPADYLLAWLLLEQGQHDQAVRRFERLYLTHPDNPEYANALVTSHLQAGMSPDRLVRRYPQPTIRALVMPHQARQSYSRKQFLRAWRLEPESFPQLDHIDTPSLGIGALYRFKSGNSGLDRLHSFITPLFYGEYNLGLSHYGAHLGLQVIQSGKLHGMGIRTLQTNDRPLTDSERRVLDQEATRLRDDLPTKAVESALIEFSWRREGTLNPFFSFGLTPIGGPLPPRPTFRLGLGDWITPERSNAHLRWNVKAYSQPVRQSLLSYSGWKMLGKQWGRVLKSGIGLTGLHQWEGSRWNVYESLDMAFLDGKGTKDNWMVGYALAPGYDFGLKAFDYFTLGPYFNFLHYGNDQNHFRLGHGGYFSPQMFYAGGVQLGLLTREGKRLMVEARLAAGIQHFKEGRSPWYPRGCDVGRALCSQNPDYPENRETSFAPSGRIRLVWQLHPHLQLAGGVYGQRTNGYNEFGAGVSLRFLFEPRAAAFSADLPPFLFGVLH